VGLEGFDQMSADPASDAPLRRTPLYAEHVALGAKMVPFAGYEMPVQYPLGILKEHLHTRGQAGLFDVSHMGQAALVGPDHATAAAALEALVPADIVNLAPGRQRYSQLLTDAGGIIDDLMVTRPAGPGSDGRLMLVVNASRKDVDYAHIAGRLPASVKLVPAPERALLAVQGPAAARIVGALCAEAPQLAFMQAVSARVGGFDCHISRTGYTGEDGFEISVAAADAVGLWRQLLGDDALAPVGLGARDSLRLEAGLCLYGHDMNEQLTPIEASLLWAISKVRRSDGARAGGFPGAAAIFAQQQAGVPRKRVGLLPQERTPVREGAAIVDDAGHEIGLVCSGGFGPTLGAPLAMGYVDSAQAALDTPVWALVRGKRVAMQVSRLPFVPQRYVRH
jgi:aminomethyltransferase